MFTQLNQLRGKIARIGASVMFLDGGRMQVLVTPVPTEEAQKHTEGLATPFVLTGTPEELDANFAQQFGALTVAYVSLADQVNDQVKAIQDAAEKSKAEAEKKRQDAVAKQAPRKGSTVTKTQLADALVGGEDTNDDDDDGGASTTPAAQPQTAATPAEPAVLSADQLFNLE